ncbi:hypothetical protein BDR05DRAFT_841609, partial [Suillus weaverae]
FVALLDYTWLGCEHPNYHTSLLTLLQIICSISPDCWKVEYGFGSLTAFASL